MLSATIGVTVSKFSSYVKSNDNGNGDDGVNWWQGPLAVSLSIFSMRLFNIVHPPGGATAIIAIIGGASITKIGYFYVLTCFVSAIISLMVALIFNNLVPWRQYPLYWNWNIICYVMLYYATLRYALLPAHIPTPPHKTTTLLLHNIFVHEYSKNDGTKIWLHLFILFYFLW